MAVNKKLQKVYNDILNQLKNSKISNNIEIVLSDEDKEKIILEDPTGEVLIKIVFKNPKEYKERIYDTIFIYTYGEKYNLDVLFNKKIYDVLRSSEYREIKEKISRFLRVLENQFIINNSIYLSIKDALGDLIDVEKRVKEAGMFLVTFIKFLERKYKSLGPEEEEYWFRLVFQLLVMYYIHRKGEDYNIEELKFTIVEYLRNKKYREYILEHPNEYTLWNIFESDLKKFENIVKNPIFSSKDYKKLKDKGIMLPNKFFIKANEDVLLNIKFENLKNIVKRINSVINEERSSILSEELLDKILHKTNLEIYFNELGILDIFIIRNWYEQDLIGEIIGGIYVGIKRYEERKNMGIYYTPKPIVKYIVDNTLERYLLDKIKEISNKEHESVKDFIYSADKEELLKFYDVLLNIKILDPACGTGHFLVYSIDKLIEYYTYIFDVVYSKNIKGLKIDLITRNRELISIDILEDLPRHLDLDPKKDFQQILDNFKFLLTSHFILKNNIFGVDIDKYAHLIAISRLILESFKYINDSTNKIIGLFPSLEANIKEGNSLIGFSSYGELKEVYSVNNGKSDKQLTIDIFIKNKEVVIDRLSKLIEDLKSGKLSLEEFNKQLNSLREEANKLFLKYIKIKSKGKVNFNIDNLNKLKPFHWIIEFPDPVITKGGFDIVIGNPPYVRQEKLKQEFSQEIGEGRYKELLISIYYPSNSTMDYSLYFSLRSLKLLIKDGYHSFIITNKWLRAKYGKDIRKYLKNSTKIIKIVEFGKIRIFSDATVDTMIYIIKKGKPNKDNKILYSNPKSLENIEGGSYFVKQSYLEDDNWNFVDERTLEIKEWIEKVGISLKNLDVNIYRGIVTGYNEAFIIGNKERKRIIEKDPKIKEIIKPVIEGKNVNRYYISYKRKYIILSYSKTIEDINKFPPLYEHFSQFKNKLLNMTHVKKGKKWWWIQSPKPYDLFKNQKIIYPDISESVTFVLDSTGFVGTNTVYFIKSKNISYRILLVILNSRLVNFYYKQISNVLGKALRFFTQYVEKIPIRLPNNTKLFETLADYLLSLNIKPEFRENLKEMINFFDRIITDSLIYELYFKEKFYEDKIYPEPKEILLEKVSKYVKPINYDKYAEIYWKLQLEEDELSQEEKEKLKKELKQLEEENLKTIQEVYKKLKNDKEIQELIEKIKNHKWVKIIEGIE